MTFGATISGNTYRVDEIRNANGTFTFASLEMYQAGLPTTYTQRTISPNGGTRTRSGAICSAAAI